MSIYPNDRGALRRRYVEAWRRHRQALPLEPVDAQIADVVECHPEYHELLKSADQAVEQEWTPESGQTNPFLHMGMHLAVRDQLATDRPAGIAEVHARLLRRVGDRHRVEHMIMDCLGAALWHSQRTGLPPDEGAYLEALRRL